MDEVREDAMKHCNTVEYNARIAFILSHYSNNCLGMRTLCWNNFGNNRI